jgi:hypothetical protein
MPRAHDATGAGTSAVSSRGQPPGVAKFIAELRAFYEQCGSPRPARLIKASRDLPELYPDAAVRVRQLPPLSKTAISEILGGKRQGLPAADWLATFVLCCQYCGFSVGALAGDPGIAGVQAWQERLRAARDPQGAAAARRLPAAQRQHVEDHGPAAVALLADAEAGDPEATYRVALLLGTHLAMTKNATALLIRSAAAGHRPSLKLLQDNPERPQDVPCSAFARCAWVLAQAAHKSGNWPETMAFSKAAERGGVTDAAIPYAAAFLASVGKNEAAARLIAAASGDQPLAGPDSLA